MPSLVPLDFSFFLSRKRRKVFGYISSSGQSIEKYIGLLICDINLKVCPIRRAFFSLVLTSVHTYPVVTSRVSQKKKEFLILLLVRTKVATLFILCVAIVVNIHVISVRPSVFFTFPKKKQSENLHS